MAASSARIDLAAIGANVKEVRRLAAPAAVCAVVKANAYGHGAAQVAEAALAAGAESLAVAQLDEAAELRARGITARVLLLSEPDADQRTLDRVLALSLELVVYRFDLISALASRAIELGVARVPVHLKVDTGMARVGCAPEDAVLLARSIVASQALELVGTMTHLAVADDVDPAVTDRQLDAFDSVLADLEAAGIVPGEVHAANSAGAVGHPSSRRDVVRLGIAMYGVSPSASMATDVDLVPALSWTTSVRHVKEVPSGTGVSYGHRYRTERTTVLATIPVGYADGLRRDYGLRGGQVLVDGRRCPVVGMVTMDQCMVDVSDVGDVLVGTEVVLIGRRGEEEITATEMADRLDTIAYEVLCGISSRVPRVAT